MDDSALLTVQQVAEKLGISKYRVYRRIHRGDIPSVPSRAGNAHFLVAQDDLDNYIAAGGGDTFLSAPKQARNPMMSTAEVAIATGFSVETVRQLCYDGRLPFVKGRTGRGQLRIPRVAVEELLNKDGIY